MASEEDNVKLSTAQFDPAVVEALKLYIVNISIALFPGSLIAEEAINTLNTANNTILQKFSSSTEHSLLVVDLSNSNDIRFSLEISHDSANRHPNEFVVIKNRSASLDLNMGMGRQLQIVTLNAKDESNIEGTNEFFYQHFQRMIRHVYAPMARAARKSGQAVEGITDEDDNVLMLQKRIRELDLVLEQCQTGTAIPSLSLPVPPLLEDAAQKTSAAVLRSCIEKFNPTQVDILFKELDLLAVMGEKEEEKEEFAKEVNKAAKNWPREIARQTHLIDSPFAGTVEKEVNFWKDLDKKLKDTKEQMDSTPVLLTKLTLRRTNRVSEQLIQEAELKLDRSITVVGVSLSFLRDFPIEDLLSAQSLHPILTKSVTSCLMHFSKLKHSQYDFSRALNLLEVLGAVVVDKIVSILKEQNVMLCSIRDLRNLKQHCDLVIKAWNSNLSSQKSVLKEIAKRRNEKSFNLKFDIDTLQHQIHAVVDFREQHERLLNTLMVVLGRTDGSKFIAELTEAFQMVLRTSTDVLDISPTGLSTWMSSLQMYERQLEKMDDHVTRILEGRLSSAKTAEEMFRIFAVFNPLFFRPGIRNAVNSFRVTLVENVRDDVKRLQEKFRMRYDDTHERVAAELRDIPPLSGRIIWAKQIEHQLTTLMKRIQDVLGVGWEDHLEGKQLREVCDELRNYLDTNQIYEEWLTQQLRSDNNRYNKLKDFLLLVEEDPRTYKKVLKVNFDEKLVVVFKEVKYLEWLLPSMTVAHKNIPGTIRARSTEAHGRYPVALALKSVLTSYSQAKVKINPGNSMLLTSHLQAVREVIQEAMGGTKRSRWIKWDSVDLNDWVSTLSSKVYALLERVDDVTEKVTRLDQLLEQLKRCPYDHSGMQTILTSVQSIVDELPMRGLSNVAPWVALLDERLVGIIKYRLKNAIEEWVAAFSYQPVEEVTNLKVSSKNRRSTMDSGAVSKTSMKALLEAGSSNAEHLTRKPTFELERTVHEIQLSNQILFVTPPLEFARSHWVTSFNKYVAVISKLSRISASRYQVFAEANSGPQDYSELLYTLPDEILKKPYIMIEKKVADSKNYLQSWLQYQALWDASTVTVAEMLQDDIPSWRKLLVEIKYARLTVDNAQEEKSFGPIVINHRQVQNKINLKYDTWQREAQLRFGAIVLEQIKTVHAELLGSKTRLEGIFLEGPTKEVIIGVEFILKAKVAVKKQQDRVNELKQSEKLLQNQRFQFPSDWLPVSNLISTYSDLCNILDRRASAMDLQLPALQLKIKEEDSAATTRNEKFLESWSAQRPMQGDLVPTEVIQQLSMFQTQLSKLKEDYERLRGAKEALNIEFMSDDRLMFVELEIGDLREAWMSVAPIHEKLQRLRTLPFKEASPVKIRKKLEELQEEVGLIPSKVRSYAAVESLMDQLTKYGTFQPVLKELCNEALKERHWKEILQRINLTKFTYITLTVGAVWDSGALNQRKAIQDTLSTAQGELALEQYLKDLREHWIGCEVGLAFRDSVRIVVGWEDVFSALEDHLNSLASLKQSPYYRSVPEFQEDTTNWEHRLTNLRGIFEIWVEVQRKWLYLRAIFRNADIKAQLQAQYTKFRSIDNEYLTLMKRVAAKPVVIDLLQLDNLQRQLERQDNTMGIIQKALGEYLERQRRIFPRFYFVNNDDLVEIIGNNNEPSKVVLHLGNMFSALCGIELTNVAGTEPGLARAAAMSSREGEQVPFLSPIDVTLGAKEWLGQLESQMTVTLASLLQDAVGQIPSQNSSLLQWIDKFPAQVVLLSGQMLWSKNVEDALNGEVEVATLVTGILHRIETQLLTLSECVLKSLDAALRKKCEQFLTELVHQRDVVRLLISQNVASATDFSWLYHLRFYWNEKSAELLQKLSIRMSNASFFYGFEYLGIGERLVQTPLTDRCFLTLTQALHFRMGANPFGPAGTGKTESVKMLGAQLGRFVLVFNCDSSFDYAAMGRIFSGLCQVGAWGCFDEFNRLEERILSAVSQQILTIQKGLLNHATQIELLGNPCKLSKDVGIFVTMNPGYAGRSNLPDNLKQLFRAVAMSVPDRKMIAQVMLYSQGIVTAEDLAGKIVLLFTLCEEQLSSQSHYDFGLRAQKSVLVGAGELKRKAISSDQGSEESKGSDLEEVEKKVLIKSTCDIVLPKLVSSDIPLFVSLLQAVFPGSELPRVDDKALVDALKSVCEEDSLEFEGQWAVKVLQLKQVLEISHGVMMVGPSGTGKSTAWRTLLKALSKVDGIKGDFFVIDPKAIKKEKLYGSLDPNTLEWTDGVFTKILRKVIDSATLRGVRRSWIVFDGDVDPEWAENLNSVLDDNKVLTLPSGDRLKIPPNVRIMMEVDSLRHATLATVSRCGMVWFAADTVSLDVLLRQQLMKLRSSAVSVVDSTTGSVKLGLPGSEEEANAQHKFVKVLTPFFSSGGLVGVALDFAKDQTHVMEASTSRLISTLYAMLLRGIFVMLEYNEGNSDFPMSDSHLEQFATKWLLYSLLWSFGGTMTTDKRIKLSEYLVSHCNVEIPTGDKISLLDLQVGVSDGEWIEWSRLVPQMEIESHKVSSSDVVITTTDTVRHVEVLRAALASHKPLILCGPPGSGKTMTLTSVLESMPEFVFASLNFSSGTDPDLILKTFAQYCEVIDSSDGLIMQPNQHSYGENQWLVVFCDEINLPTRDLYGTQKVIMFLRQLVEHGGFWNNDCKWVNLRRVQFVGACNPPTDAGREVLTDRFLRLAPVLLVDYPAEDSLKQIYRCFNHALLKLHPNLKGFVNPMNNAMVHFYLQNQAKFTPDVAPQYIYSPRELSRWVRALYEAMEPLDAMTAEELLRLWGHEALRLFQDRLVSFEEKEWCEEELMKAAERFFPGVDVDQCLQKPILFSNWIKKTYESTDREVLRNFVGARLKVFYEEALDVPLVVFDEVLDHVLRIDNVLRHPMGHLLLVGESGAGKTVLTRFVAWMNGLTVFQIKANNRYTIEQFDDDLRQLFRRVGVDGEKICFIFDESNALSSAFLERMNALLASGEVPGLFEGEERVQLMAACRESFSQMEGVMLDSEDELSRRFTKIIQRNLHVVFTMNPLSSDFSNRCTTSPALFNRCVVDWFGTWSKSALAQVGYEFTRQLDTGYTEYHAPQGEQDASADLSLVLEAVKTDLVTLSEAVVAALVRMHCHVKDIATRLGKVTGRPHYLSPRDFLDLIKKFTSTEQEKRDSLEDQQTHIRTGLQKLEETKEQVATLNQEMVAKSEILKQKDAEANQKLEQMVEKQNETEQRKTLAEQLTKELKERREEIRVRMETVNGELSEAEPALQSSKLSVQNIRKAQLDEVRSLQNPPQAVQTTLEMVSIMIGESNLAWNEIRKVIRKEDFISTVVNFDPLMLNEKQVKSVEKYLKNSDLDYAAVDRASKACGPLYRWAESQIKYATILKKVQPLREEVSGLQAQSEKLEVQQREAVANVEELEQAIKQYKAEYAAAIRDTETIRTEMEQVFDRVGRAQALLGSLELERVRWQETSQSFDQQMSTLIGDSLLAAAFLTYAGIFDHKARRSLMIEWAETLESLAIPFRPELEIIPYLSKPSDQVYWRDCGLPTDDLATENAILLERFHRFPLIIDPSGQATNFILKKYADRQIIQTSFLDNAFMKTLGTAIRFGKPLLVHDVEGLDPMLNPVLNRELQQTGGRTLIRVGSEDIDYSPKFVMVLLTRNPLAHFAPDLCSRVTMVNFTVTPASLESQALSAILKSERPDVDQRRTEVLRLQGEQSAKLRELQDALLNQISAVEGKILDDNRVINTLEKIKAEATQLNLEVSSTKDIMDDVKAISNQYTDLAGAMATVYFSLENLADVSFLYQYNLNFFLGLIDKVLAKANENKTQTETAARLKLLSNSFFQEVSRRVLRGLRYEDKLMFLTRLALICTQGRADSDLSDAEMDLLLRGGTAAALLGHSASSVQLQQKFQAALPDGLITEDMAKELVTLNLLPVFSGLMNSFSSDTASWTAFFASAEPEKVMPASWRAEDAGASNSRVALLAVMLLKALRPERVVPALEVYLSTVFGEDSSSGSGFDFHEHFQLDLREIVERDTQAYTPLMLCSEAGQDASGKVDALSSAMNRELLQVSMGSSEGFASADRSISRAAKSGSWVLLRNVHLCCEWLGGLEKRLHEMTAHDNFRLFLTCEIHSSLPSSLLRMSEIVVFEASTGMKANMLRFYNSIPKARVDEAPAERCRMYTLLAWFNAVVQERLRYLPLGWTKAYEFSEADAACALAVVDQWLDVSAGGRAHVSPTALPWSALRVLLSQSLYGGRVDHPFDQAALDSFINSIFTAESYNTNAPLSKDHTGAHLLKLPENQSRSAFESWLKALPDTNPPSWIGLPATAESQLRSQMARRILSKLAVLQLQFGAMDTREDSSKPSSKDGGVGVRQELEKLNQMVEAWLSSLPADLSDTVEQKKSTDDPTTMLPIERFKTREFEKGHEVVSLIRHDLVSIRGYCKGESKLSNDLRALLGNFRAGIVPAAWSAALPGSTKGPLGAWVAGLATRARQLNKYLEPASNSVLCFRIGEMFSPETFINATRQQTAQANGWSLEDVELYLSIGGKTPTPYSVGKFDCLVDGLVLEGAEWSEEEKEIRLCERIHNQLPPSVFQWRLKPQKRGSADVGDTPDDVIALPLYANELRKMRLSDLFVRAPKAVAAHVWAQRGVAVVLKQTSG